jgi:hypothetical protein
MKTMLHKIMALPTIPPKIPMYHQSDQAWMNVRCIHAPLGSHQMDSYIRCYYVIS